LSGDARLKESIPGETTVVMERDRGQVGETLENLRLAKVEKPGK